MSNVNTSASIWFNPDHFNYISPTTNKSFSTTKLKIINEPIYGYVLPHASTQYTANIIQHTLRIRNVNYAQIRRVFIFYYPAMQTENIILPGVNGGNFSNSLANNNNMPEKYYHEYYVPWKSINTIFPQNNIEFYGFNVRDNIGNIPAIDSWLHRLGKDTWVIISADYSHFLKTQQAIALENKAAMALCYKQWSWSDMDIAVDNSATFSVVFKYVLDLLSSSITPTLRWVGRTRSPGTNGVGYLSFIITAEFAIPFSHNSKPTSSVRGVSAPSGIFVTCYDTKFNARECLGNWLDKSPKTTDNIRLSELALIKEVLYKARTTSRLTGGTLLSIPIAYYTVTYLFRSKSREFIRGWHGVFAENAFYLPEVFLENTYENGNWINPNDSEWPDFALGKINFNMAPTLDSLRAKSGITTTKYSNKYILYDAYVKHRLITHPQRNIFGGFITPPVSDFHMKPQNIRSNNTLKKIGKLNRKSSKSSKTIKKYK